MAVFQSPTNRVNTSNIGSTLQKVSQFANITLATSKTFQSPKIGSMLQTGAATVACPLMLPAAPEALLAAECSLYPPLFYVR